MQNSENTITTNATLTQAIKNYLQFKKMESELKKSLEESKTTISDALTMAKLTDCEYLTAEGEVFYLGTKLVPRTDIDRERLQNTYPTVWEDVKVLSEHSRLFVKPKAKDTANDVLNTELAKVETKTKKVTSKKAVNA